VEALTHDSIVVQINRLKNRRRTELERLLEVFDQGLASRSDPHLLDILEENFPEHHRAVLRRLMRAGAEQEVRDSMDVEDDIMTAFQDQARESADLRQALVEKDKVIEKKELALEEKDQVIGKMDQVIEEKDQVIEEKDRLIAELKRRLSRSS
jgi:septal ring factor EnvC (AmiA/AmiB activator)